MKTYSEVSEICVKERWCCQTPKLSSINQTVDLSSYIIVVTVSDKKSTASNWMRNSKWDTNLGSPHKKLSLWCYLSDISPSMRAKGVNNKYENGQKINPKTWIEHLTYRTFIARRTLVHSLFFVSILRGRLDSTFPLPMYVPPDPFPLNRVKLQTNDARNTFPNTPRIGCVANASDPPKQTSSIFDQASRCRTS